MSLLHILDRRKLVSNLNLCCKSILHSRRKWLMQSTQGSICYLQNFRTPCAYIVWSLRENLPHIIDKLIQYMFIFDARYYVWSVIKTRHPYASCNISSERFIGSNCSSICHYSGQNLGQEWRNSNILSGRKIIVNTLKLHIVFVTN